MSTYELVVIGDVENPEDAARSFLHTTLTHIAEFQIKMLEVVSRQFGITKEALVEAIRDAPEFQSHNLAKEVIEKVLVQGSTDTLKSGNQLSKTKSGKKIIIKNKV